MSEFPDRPDLEQLRRRAKELCRAAAAGEHHARARLRLVSDQVSLASAQLALAREHGFSSWPSLKAAIETKLASGVAPLMVGKHREKAVSRPEGFLKQARSQGWQPGPLPIGVIFTSTRCMTNHLSQHPERYQESTELTPTNGRVFLTSAEPIVAIACLGVGPSAMVTQVEHLLHLGVTVFLAVGPAPAVSQDLRPGDCVVVGSALRDDGVSQHYLEPARYAFPDAELTRGLAAAAQEVGLAPVVGPAWTVPTPYRTTAKELVAYRGEGVLVSEMTAAALFAVSAAIGARSASAVVVSRSLEDAGDPGGDRHAGASLTLLDAAISVLQRSDGGRR
jgi:uridine phosphorylase